MLSLKQKTMKITGNEPYSPDVDEKVRHCPNCGKECKRSDLNHYSSIKTIWGGSVLYGVCKECARIHSITNKTPNPNEP